MAYFTRGPGPLASVLIPSRARFDWLLRSARSFAGLARDPGSVEVIVKLDDDDAESLRRVAELPRGCRVLVSSRGEGYPDLWRWVNDMARLARGDWLLPFNDDSWVESANWDAELDALAPPPGWGGSADVALVNCADSDGKIATVFPLVRRAACDYLGHVALNAHWDTWLQEVYAPAGAALELPAVRIHHHYNRPDGPSPFSVVAGSTSYPDLVSPAGRTLRAKDTRRLRRMLGHGNGD